MLRTLAALQLVVGNQYGFFGLRGLFGLFVGLCVLIVFVGIMWKIMTILLKKYVQDADWQQIIRLVLTLFIIVVFLHFFGLY
jgi:divalent metal cation (Fe/Co/Zn/Cd) transporter